MVVTRSKKSSSVESKKPQLMLGKRARKATSIVKTKIVFKAKEELKVKELEIKKVAKTEKVENTEKVLKTKKKKKEGKYTEKSFQSEETEYVPSQSQGVLEQKRTAKKI